MITVLHDRGTLTVSKEIRRKLGINPGDQLDVRISDGQIIITPVAVVPRTLMLTDSGRKKIEESEKDLKRGRVKRYASAADLLKELNETGKD